MSLTKSQLDLRRSGISASDVAAIVGVSPYRSRIDVWREKRGEAEPRIDTERSKWGDLLEPVIRDDYAERHGVRVEVPGTLTAGFGEGWMIATPDGVCYPPMIGKATNGLEIKCHNWRFAHLYGSPGSDEIPQWELCQVAWNMAVTGLSRWDLVAFIDGQPIDYRVMRDQELIEHLTEVCEQFLVDNIRGGAVPEPDGSDSYDAWLRARWAKSTGVVREVGSFTADVADAMTALIEHGRELLTRIDLDEKELARVVQGLKVSIGDSAGLAWADQEGKLRKIRWSHNKPSAKVDWQCMARRALTDAQLAASGLGPAVERALICLAPTDHTPIGSSSRAAMDLAQLRELVQQLWSTVESIAERDETGYTTESPGKRPFCWPTGWASGKKEQ